MIAILGRFARIFPLRLLVGVVLVAAATAAGVGLLAVSGTLITGAALAGAGLIVFDVFQPGSVVRFLAVARTLARYAERLATHDATLRFIALLRVDAFRGMAAGFQGSERPGVLFNRLTGDLDSLDGVLIRFVMPLVAAGLVLGGTAIAVSSVDGPLALAMVAPVVILGVAAPLVLAGRASRSMRGKLAAMDAARIRVADLDRGRASLAASGTLVLQLAKAEDAVTRAARAELILLRLDTILRILAGLGTTVSVVATASVAEPLVRAGGIEPTTFAALLLVALALAEAVAPLRAITIDLGRWNVSARRLEPILAACEETFGRRRGARVGAPALRLSGITVASGSATMPRLTAVDFDALPGATVALTGPSGAGKSTLLAVLSGTLKPTAGTVDMGGAGPPRIAALGQRTELFRGTVADNLRLADPTADEAAMLRVLSEVRLLDALGRDGLARMLGDEGSGLSGGERRRLAIARLMLQDADLVLLDEPTEGLDAATARAVFGALLAWGKGRTLVYATHRPEEADRAERIFAFSAGVVRKLEPTTS